MLLPTRYPLTYAHTNEGPHGQFGGSTAEHSDVSYKLSVSTGRNHDIDFSRNDHHVTGLETVDAACLWCSSVDMALALGRNG